MWIIFRAWKHLPRANRRNRESSSSTCLDLPGKVTAVENSRDPMKHDRVCHVRDLQLRYSIEKFDRWYKVSSATAKSLDIPIFILDVPVSRSLIEFRPLDFALSIDIN